MGSGIDGCNDGDPIADAEAVAAAAVGGKGGLPGSARGAGTSTISGGEGCGDSGLACAAMAAAACCCCAELCSTSSKLISRLGADDLRDLAAAALASATEEEALAEEAGDEEGTEEEATAAAAAGEGEGAGAAGEGLLSSDDVASAVTGAAVEAACGASTISTEGLDAPFWPASAASFFLALMKSRTLTRVGFSARSGEGLSLSDAAADEEDLSGEAATAEGDSPRRLLRGEGERVVGEGFDPALPLREEAAADFAGARGGERDAAAAAEAAEDAEGDFEGEARGSLRAAAAAAAAVGVPPLCRALLGELDGGSRLCSVPASSLLSSLAECAAAAELGDPAGAMLVRVLMAFIARRWFRMRSSSSAFFFSLAARRSAFHWRALALCVSISAIIACKGLSASRVAECELLAAAAAALE